MDDSISTFCKTLVSFCKHIHSASQALKESVDRRPIPLDSASFTFIQCLNRRVSSVSGDLNLLESMVLGTVSFEELLGHCNEVYKKNQKEIRELEDHLQSFGYVPDVEIDDEIGLSDLDTPVGIKEQSPSPENGSDFSSIDSDLVKRRLDEDPTLDDPMCIKDLDLSDACLATLASEAHDELASSSPEGSSHNSMSSDNGKQHEKNLKYELSSDSLSRARTAHHCSLTSGDTQAQLKISKDDYDRLPSYMKSLASWEDLQAAVVKMNSMLCKKVNSVGEHTLNQDEIASLELGAKARSYLLLLLRMNQLLVETAEGSIVYRLVR